MVRPSKKQQVPNLQDAVKETAWKQIADTGAATLSLRSIARELGITAPAIYNYYSDRDALVTALIVDAYTSLGESQQAAIDAFPVADNRSRLSALGLAYREWAITYPQRYLLIFGTPIPNYVAPVDVTMPAAACAIIPLINTLQALQSSGQLRIERLSPMTPKLHDMMQSWKNNGGNADIEVLFMTTVIWSRVHGMVMLEIGHHTPPSLFDPGEIFRREVNNILSQYL